MANNIAVGPNAIVAKSTVSFATAGITALNTAIIFRVDASMQSYVPGRGINGITGFEAGKGYYMQALQAMDLESSVVPPITSLAQLAAPGSFTATAASQSQINLSWATSPNATAYIVDRATNSGFTTGVALAIYSGSGTSYNDTGRTASTQYFYRIRATASGYTDSSYSTANATTNAASAYILDQFTGTNGANINGRSADTGQAWDVDTGSLEINTNMAQATVANRGVMSRATLDVGAANVSAEIEFDINNVDGNPVGILCRYVDENNHYRVQLATGGNGFRIYQVSGGTETLVQFATVGTGNLLRVVCNGNTITGTQGSATVSYNAATLNPTSTKMGVHMTRSNNLNDITMGEVDTINYFLAWPGTGAPPSNPIYP
jgi:hypothetical protein